MTPLNFSWLPPFFAEASERLANNFGELAGNATYLKCCQRVLEFLYERQRFIEAA